MNSVAILDLAALWGGADPSGSGVASETAGSCKVESSPGVLCAVSVSGLKRFR